MIKGQNPRERKKTEMKVLMVAYSRAMYGAAHSLLALIKDLRDRYGVECCVLMSSVNDGELAEVLEKEGIEYIIAPMKNWVIPSDENLKKLRGLSAQIKTAVLHNRLMKRIGKRKFDLVYSNNSTVQEGSYISGSMNIPHIWHIREYGRPDFGIDFSYPLRLVRKKFGQAAAVITVSGSLRKYYRKKYGIDSVTIYNGVDVKTDKTDTDEGKHVEIHGVTRFVCAGTLQSGKNQLELIKAAGILQKRGITDFVIEIVGSGEAYEKELKKYISENDIKNVCFNGYKDDVPAFLRDMDAGVMCSRAEAFGRVTCEYMAAHLPVIGAASGGTVDIIADGETGFLYKPGVPEKLAEKMQILIEDKRNGASLMKKMGEAGYNRVSTEFTVRKNTDSIYKLFCNAVENG